MLISRREKSDTDHGFWLMRGAQPATRAGARPFAGSPIPAKGRAPARVAGWAPRISQKPWSVSDFSRLEISIH